jgi:anti-sigma factor RsiW
MTDEHCCANFGELRKVVEDVAKKAANSAAEKVHLQMKVELIQMEKRLTDDMSRVIDARLDNSLGMTPQEHLIQHDQIRRTNDFFGDFRSAFWKKAMMTLAFGAIVFLGGYLVDYKISKKKNKEPFVLREQLYPSSQERPDAPNP